MTAHQPNPDFIKLKEKIATCSVFTVEERNLILEALNLGTYKGQHSYPSNYGPDSKSQWVRAGWEIMDQFPPDAMKVTNRYMLAGMIAGALQQMYEAGKSARH